MARITIDLRNYRNNFGDRVNPGRYLVAVDYVRDDGNSAKGNPMIIVLFRVIGGEFDGATIADRLILSEKSLWRVVEFLQALGIKTPRQRLEFDINSWVGKRLEIDADDGEPFRGKIKSEVRGYLKLVASSAQPEKDLDDLVTAPSQVSAAFQEESAAGMSEAETLAAIEATPGPLDVAMVDL